MTSTCLVTCMTDKKRHKKSLGETKAFKEFATLLKHIVSQKASNGDGDF